LAPQVPNPPKSRPPGDTAPVKPIASNPGVRSDYFFEEIVEAGLALTGTEVKSLRAQPPTLRDSFIEVRPSAGSLEAWLLNCHIPPYSHGNIWNHEPLRPRKLLLHRRQIERIFGAVTQKGLTAVPIRMYFKGGKAKIEVGIGRGKKKFDKREEYRKKSARREMDAAKRASARLANARRDK
jgi:SsrA-binding protein